MEDRFEFNAKWFDYRTGKITEKEWFDYLDTVPNEWIKKKGYVIRKRVESGFQ